MTTGNTPNKNVAFGVVRKEEDLIDSFLTGPGQFLVLKTLQQMAKVPGFTKMFGPMKVDDTKLSEPLRQAQRWSDYARYDWSLRQLPAISVFEAETETKQSSNAFLDGSVNIQVFWPPNMRRSDLARVPQAFKAALQNFFESALVFAMLDPHINVYPPERVGGLNKYGAEMNWSPNTEGIVEGELVPVTMVTVKYRIDLRYWYKFLEFDNRTKDQPFERTLADLTTIGGVAAPDGFFEGVTDNQAEDVEVVVQDEFTVSNP